MARESQKQNWLFLRGLSREVAHWEGFPQAFQKHLSGVRAFAIDLPGNGENRGTPTPLTLTGLVEFVRKEWKEQNPETSEPICIFALSLGAMVALQWMHLYPKEIRCAVLVNTSLRGFSPFFQRLSPAVYLRLLQLFLSRSASAREKIILGITSQRKEWSAQEIAERARIQKKRPVGKLNAFRQILAALSPVASRKTPTQPVLILNSLGDELVHPDCSRAIAEAWNVPLRRHAWAGHDLPLDDPQWTLRAVEEWLGSLEKMK